MEEEKDKYINCSQCKLKYHNNEDNIKNDFGYNRLGERFKCCVRCRNRAKKYADTHKTEISERSQKYREEHKEKQKEYKEKQLTNTNEYIICAHCRLKYINDNEHIEKDFRYNRLKEKLKTCVKCRESNRKWREEHKEHIKEHDKKYREENKEKYKEQHQQYAETHREEINEYKKQYRLKQKEKGKLLKEEADKSNGEILYCYRCIKNKPYTEFLCPNGKTYNSCYRCLQVRYGD